MELLAGFGYRIRNKYSKMFISVFGHGNVQSPERRTGEDFLSYQTWYVHAINDGDHIVFNKRCGLLLSIEDDSDLADAPVVQQDLQVYVPTSQTWSITRGPREPDTSPFVRIKNVNSGMYLTSSGDEPDAVNRQSPALEHPPYDDVQLWEFILADSRSNVTDFSWCANGGKGDNDNEMDVIPMTSLNRPDPEATEPVLVGKALVPCVLVKDPLLDRPQQSTLSPFYELRRYRFCKMIHFRSLDGPVHVPDHVLVKVGLVTGDADTVLAVLGISVHVTGHFRLTDTVFRFMSDKILRHLRVNSTSGITDEHSEDMYEGLIYSARHSASYALWAGFNRYVLLRKDRSKVLEWTMNVGPPFKVDTFPAVLN